LGDKFLNKREQWLRKRLDESDLIKPYWCETEEDPFGKNKKKEHAEGSNDSTQSMDSQRADFDGEEK
jgi:hypothetical protein